MTRRGLMNWMVVAAVGIGMCLAGAGCGPKEAAAPSDPGTPAVKDEGSAPAETPVAPKDVGGSGTIETIGEGADTITLVRVEGTRYEMGYWRGKLLADQIAETWKLANGMVQKMADEVGLPIAMFDDLAGTLWNEKYFDTKAWGEEYQGVADGCAAAGHPEITFEVMKKLAA
ncbi:MAG: hypothetical protein GY851_26455, partial [bacterium]|nr:hypothetical protein [bacterium]